MPPPFVRLMLFVFTSILMRQSCCRALAMCLFVNVIRACLEVDRDLRQLIGQDLDKSYA